MNGLDSFDHQAFDLDHQQGPRHLRRDKEDPKTRDRHGKGLGELLLLARRLCEGLASAS